MSWELHRITIVGGGMMGRSLAIKVAQEGIHVYLKEVSSEAVDTAQNALERTLDRSIERFSLTNSEKKAILSRITWVTQFDCATDSDLALEAVQEDFGLKRQILRELDRRMPPENPVVLTTSTLSITELAAQNNHPERIVGMHFLFPVTTTRVVEVVRGQLTTDEVYERAIEFARLLGKIPIKVFEMPGFVTTRVLLP
ncbi:MAG: 3-hydroxyacyl-CoA dehydrogenase NAD-binding domain-containing protein, partial [Acidobacteriota bacterium]